MTKPNPIIVMGALFLLGIAALLTLTRRLESMPALELNTASLNFLLVIVPVGLVLPLLSLVLNVDTGLRIAVIVASLVQLAALGAVVWFVCRFLNRFSSALAFLGGLLVYPLLCYGTNLLFLRSLFP